AARRVDRAVDRERRPFELELGSRAEVVGLEPPRDFELIEVAGVDLIERRVARPLHVRRVVGPVALRAARRIRLPGDPDVEARRGEGERRGDRSAGNDCPGAPAPRRQCSYSHCWLLTDVVGRSVNFCTRQLRSSATYNSFSEGQAISWIQPNCFAW